MTRQNKYDVFLILGLVWLIVGYLIFENSSLLALGFIFLIAWGIGRFAIKK